MKKGLNLPGLAPAPIHLKVCGLTRPDNALECVAAGAQIIGLVFHDASPRNLSRDQAREITRILPQGVPAWGVFVDKSYEFIMERVARCHLDAVQLHGKESPELVSRLKGEGLGVIKALFGARAPGFETAHTFSDADAILVEYGKGTLPGGNAESWDYRRATGLTGQQPLVLAGGLTPENIATALAQARPAAVDVSSGVESDFGIKNPDRVNTLARAIQAFTSC